MDSWRDKILNQFVPLISKLSLVSDPDNLLTEENMAIELRNKGFDILEFSNAVEFRYSYESQYRTIWDSGKKTELVVILHTDKSDLNNLPFDLLETGKQFHFKIADIFPLFSPPILEKLERNMLDRLYSLKQLYPEENLSDDSTIDFFFRNLYNIDIKLICDKIGLLKALLILHFSNFEIPEKMLQYLEEKISEKSIFNDINPGDLIYDKSKFIDFVITKHKSFLNRSPEVLMYQYIKKSPEIIEKHLETLLNQIPSIDSNNKEWISFACKLASLSSSIYLFNNEYISNLKELSENINAVYIQWLQAHISGLIQKPHFSPVMVHHIPHYLSSQFLKTNKRIALVVIDGLSLEQWFTLKECSLGRSYKFNENGVFSWIPTITSVSRQAIFSGKRPYEYEKCINTTLHEEKYWHLFWENTGLNNYEILFKKGIKDDFNFIEECVSDSRIKIFGVIINKVDEIMHGIRLGMQGMHSQIRMYAETGHLSNFFDILVNNNFDIYLTSDHGNIDCIGSGNPQESAIAMSRGERARIYKHKELLSKVKEKYPESIEWLPINLPNNYYPLLSGINNAFIQKGQKVISHGSISIQETIVPFIKVEKK